MEMGARLYFSIDWDNMESWVPDLRLQGITAVELSYLQLMSHPESVLERGVRQLNQAGIRVWSVHAPSPNDQDYLLSRPNDLDRRRAVETNKTVLERVALSGASVAVIHPGRESGPVRDSAVVSRFLKSLEELLPVAERLGVRLALENMQPLEPAPWRIGLDSRELRQMVEQLQCESLGVCFDTGHAYRHHSFREDMEVLKDTIIHFHLDDNDTTRDLHLPPGYGSIPWDDFIDLFQTMDFTDPIVIEARPWQGDGYGQLCRETRALLEGKLLKINAGEAPAKVQCLACGHLRFGTAEDNWCACQREGDPKGRPRRVARTSPGDGQRGP